MLPERAHHSVMEEIELFIEYGVTEDLKAVAKRLVREYGHNPSALMVLLEFYKVLPEAREEAVERIAHIDAHQGVQLVAVMTHGHTYTAVISESEAHILGEYRKNELPQEVLTFFGHSSNEAFEQATGKVEDLLDFGAGTKRTLCPACQAEAGSYHLFGCPVEVCPWCDAQLSKCNCRFEQLNLENIETEEQLEEFKTILDHKGRVPFNVEQKPAYPGTSQGLDSN